MTKMQRITIDTEGEELKFVKSGMIMESSENGP